MNLEHYNNLLAQPQRISIEDAPGLDRVVRQFPYFQSAQALRLKILKQTESLGYNQALKTTAAVTTDRDVLFDYITSPEFSQQTISETLIGHQDHVKQIEVTLDNPENAPEIPAPELEENAWAVDKKPFNFDQKERHSFEQWLKLTAAKPVFREPEDGLGENADRAQDPNNSEDKWGKIDRFLAQKTSIKPDPLTSKQNRAESSLETHDELMTETLARVYAQQKNYQKAIQAYKILILKYPEKSSFFADQIRELKRLLNA